MAQIKVILSNATRVNGKTIPAGARRVSEKDAAALRDMEGVTFIDEAPAGGQAASTEFVIERACGGAEAERIHDAMVAHIAALKAAEKPAEPPAAPSEPIAQPGARRGKNDLAIPDGSVNTGGGI